MHSEDTAWLAGLLEGEGYFQPWRLSYTDKSYGPGYRPPKIDVNMTDRDVLEKAQRITSAGNVWALKNYEPHRVRTPMWRWSVTKKDDVQRIATAVLPHMCSRRSQVVSDLLESIRAQAKWATRKTKGQTSLFPKGGGHFGY